MKPEEKMPIHDTELCDRRLVHIPTVYSLIAGDFSIIQQRILLNIIREIQLRIKEGFEKSPHSTKYRDNVFYLELWKKDIVTIDIPISNLNVIPSDYWQIEKGAATLIRKTIKYPLIGYKGKILRYEKIALFNNLEVLLVNSGVRRTGTLRVFLRSQDLRTLIVDKYGFVNCVMNIVYIAKKKRTPRLYFLLSRFKSHTEILYRDLQEYLGITDEYYCEFNDGKNPYLLWSKVKDLILNPVKEEMDTLLANEKIDMSFTYSPIYEKKRKRGLPSAVHFDVIRHVANNDIVSECENNTEKRCVYYAEFQDGFAYVGTTSNYKKRVSDHLFEDSKSEVYKHKRHTGMIPTFSKLTDYISIEESNKLEYDYTIKFASQGKRMLNLQKPGGYGKRKK